MLNNSFRQRARTGLFSTVQEDKADPGDPLPLPSPSRITFLVPIPIMEHFKVAPYYRCVEVIGEGAYGVVVYVASNSLEVLH